MHQWVNFTIYRNTPKCQSVQLDPVKCNNIRVICVSPWLAAYSSQDPCETVQEFVEFLPSPRVRHPSSQSAPSKHTPAWFAWFECKNDRQQIIFIADTSWDAAALQSNLYQNGVSRTALIVFGLLFEGFNFFFQIWKRDMTSHVCTLLAHGA